MTTHFTLRLKRHVVAPVILGFATAIMTLVMSASAYADSVSLVKNPASLVDPLIGTAGSGVYAVNLFPGADVPFGMVQWGPDTPSRPPGGGYKYTDSKITGFSLNHMSGPGCGAYGDVPFLPTVGPIGSSPGSASESFSHSTETAKPGFYSVSVGQPATKVQLSTTMHSGIGRFVYPATDQANMLLKLSGSQASVDNIETTIVNDHEIIGSVTTGHFCGAGNTYTLHFYLEFNRPFRKSGTFSGSTTPQKGQQISNPDGIYVTFDTTSNRVVQAKVGMSYVSAENAMANLQAEQPGWNLALVRRAAYAKWNQALSKIQIGGGSKTDQTIFYTALYHSLLQPNVFSDINGQYNGFDGDTHRMQAGHAEYANYSSWDTYRSEIPLQALLFPDRTSDIVRTMLNDYRQTGRFPKWSQANGESYVMVGDPADPIIAGAYAFGARDFDKPFALQAMQDEATQSNNVRPGLNYLKDLGYLPTDGNYGCCNYYGPASTTLEYNTADFAIGAFAQALGNDQIADKFMSRAQDWQNLFNPGSGFIQPKLENGQFRSGFSPTSGSGFVEGDSWQYTPEVPFNVQGLIAGMGGRKAFTQYLDSHFTQLNEGGSSRYAWMGNEPELEVPWEYDYAGKPWRTQKVVRRVQQALYKAAPDGEAGNDDLGAMSSWYVWSALGMYPETPGTTQLALGSAVFPKAVVHLPNGQSITINAPQAATDNPYIQDMQVNGMDWNRAYLPSSLVQNGGTVTETLGSQPNKSFATKPEAAPRSWMTGGAPALAWTAPSGQIVTSPGGSDTTVKLGVQSLIGKTQTVSWTATSSSGVSVSPDHGQIQVPAAENSGQQDEAKVGRATQAVTIEPGSSDGRYQVTYELESSTGAELPKVVQSVAVAEAGDLGPYYNNTGIGGNYDGVGYGYSESALSNAGLAPGQTVTSNGIQYMWPDVDAGQSDNIDVAGQTIQLPAKPGATKLGFLGSATNGPSVGQVKITYKDGTTQMVQLGFSDWTLNAGGSQPSYDNAVVTTMPYRQAGGGTQQVKTYVFSATVPLQSGKTAASVTLPQTVNQGDLHVFAIGTNASGSGG